MTASAPDRAAIERARVALRRGAKPGDPIPMCRCFKLDRGPAARCFGVCEEAAENVAAAITAAVAEERERIGKAFEQLEFISTKSPYWDDNARRTLGIVKDALAPPAQSET